MTADTTSQVGPPLLDPAQAPPLDRFCDVVMKGGVTDGVVYPWAVMELAQHYRFQSIGGTSVGAVAAALTAASEYSRRYGSVQGFNKVLREVPLGLAELQDGGQTKLFSLFHPAPGSERLFRLFVGLFSQKGGWTVVKRLLADYVWGLDLSQRRDRGIVVLTIPGLCLLIWLCLVYPATVLPMTLVLLTNLAAITALGVLFLCWRLYGDVRNHLGGPGNGLCTGLGPAQGPDGFTDWLHKGIQAASGRPLDLPLTFRDLWDAPGGPAAPAIRGGPDEREPSIALQMMSTNLTHGRPCGLPLNANSERLYFRDEDLAPYFPESVMCHLRACAPILPAHIRLGLRELPRADLPVLVAARLSLSFPVLFKAVPLWAVPEIGAPYRCWFSDGGICANFPIHLFDAVLPRWPTYGITLVDRAHPNARVGDVWIHDAGSVPPELQQEASQAQHDAPSLGRLLGFLGSILSAARLWNDNATARLPGVRERVVNINLRGKGGLNLTVEPDALLAMAALGQEAGQQLVARYITAATGAAQGTQPSAAWETHRWIRFNTFVRALRAKMSGFAASAQHTPQTHGLKGVIDGLDSSLPNPNVLGAGFTLTTRQAQSLRNAEQALTELEHSLANNPVVQAYEPYPQPELRLRATL